jgi:hypothetical protein
LAIPRIQGRKTAAAIAGRSMNRPVAIRNEPALTRNSTGKSSGPWFTFTPIPTTA